MATEPGAGLAGITAGHTAIATVGKEGKGLTYRGYSIHDLAEHSTFEEVAYLLIYGHLPKQVELDEYKVKLRGMRGLPAPLKTVLELIPRSTHPMDVMRTGCSMLGTLEPEGPGHDQVAVANRLTACFSAMLLYWHHFHTGKRRLVFNISSQLRKCPLTHAISLLFPERCPVSDAFEVFDGHSPTGVCSFRNDLLCNRMVGIRFKSSLSTRERFQFTFGVQRPFAVTFLPGRFSLKRSLHLYIMLSCPLDIIALMHLTVAVNGEIDDAEIHSDEIGHRLRRDFRYLNGHKQKPLAVLALYQVALPVFSIKSFGLVLTHHNRNDGPAFDRQQRNTVNSLKAIKRWS